jgi:hypothetical protein
LDESYFGSYGTAIVFGTIHCLHALCSQNLFAHLTLPPPASSLRLSVVLETPDERRIPNTAAGVPDASNRTIVAEAGELVLHCLRQNRPLNVRVLRSFRGELGIEIVRVESVDL